MPFISDDHVATFAKREQAHRTHLAGLMTLVLALALSTILPTLKSQITSITSDSHLLSRDFCGIIERDDCPTDPNKTKPGVCKCGVLDTDTDGDGTPDCKDSCLHAASKTTSGMCVCGFPDTDLDGDGTPNCLDLCPGDATKTSYGVCGCDAPDTDTNGDRTLNCCSDCIDDDPFRIIENCERNPGFCEYCSGKYIRSLIECGLMCQSDIDYCLDYSGESWHVNKEQSVHY